MSYVQDHNLHGFIFQELELRIRMQLIDLSDALLGRCYTQQCALVVGLSDASADCGLCSDLARYHVARSRQYFIYILEPT